jgi:hypothetical protein
MKMKMKIPMAFLIFCLSTFSSLCFGGKFNIYPNSIVVKAGHTVRFTAVAEENNARNFTPEDCLWTATGGNIDSNGNYRAHKEPGVYEVSVYANGKVSKAEVTVVATNFHEGVKQGAIFIRNWHFYPAKVPGQINARLSASIRGETVKTAKVFLINADGSEMLLDETKTRHNGRAEFHTSFTPAEGQWIDFKTYDHLNRIIAHTRRMI